MPPGGPAEETFLVKPSGRTVPKCLSVTEQKHGIQLTLTALAAELAKVHAFAVPVDVARHVQARKTVGTQLPFIPRG